MTTVSALSNADAAGLHQKEPASYGPPATQFPIQIELGGQAYTVPVWKGEQLPDQLLAYDTETRAIEAKEIPQIALATVYGDQGSAYFIHPDQLSQFIIQHSQVHWCCHNATFDFWVTALHLQDDPAAVAAWWDMVGDSRLLCTMLLDNLIGLARTDEEPISRDLATVAAEYCPGLHLDKDDPYRLRYGELIGLPVAAWPATEPGFWHYAARDPVATLLVAQRQFQITQQLIAPYGTALLPDALRRFGPLTACLQVQGSIALDYASRSGVQLDLEQAKQLQESITILVEQHGREMETMLPGCFKRYGSRSQRAGQMQLTDAGVPKRNAKLIKGELQRIAEAGDPPLQPPRNKDQLVTDSVKYWEQHRDLNPFVATFVGYSEQAKLAQFFKQLDQQRIYPRYRPLVRTGRTSCSNPNLQQLPRDSRFREMIIAPPGYWLLQVDYSVLELRTLAQICLGRYGRSVLADLFHQGIDPHKYTATLLLGTTLEQFQQLPEKEQKQHRQRAKAVNFGVPGGLGALSLVSYAKHSYGVQLTLDEAKQFRQKLVREVYPELQAYLTDNQHADISRNLQATEAQVKQALYSRDQILTVERIVSGCKSTLSGDEYHPELVQNVWALLQQLNRNPDLVSDLAAQQSDSTLMRRILYGDALTISGRLRGHVGYTQRANTPFQGLAADGNKLALFRLLRAGFQVCGFIHDEMLVLIPDGVDYVAAVQHVQQILADAMQELTPDIPISTEYLLADRWYKDVDDQPIDGAGRIVPYRQSRAGQELTC
ncbi:MAG: hypothetical protein K8T91_05785 [Planctomycetes bacterium]|nr:hypothetical protein [Planctomycetota bacterium]